MRKFVFMFFLLVVFCTTNIYAADYFDKSKLSNGVVGVNYTGDFEKKIKVKVEKDNEEYIYNIKNSKTHYIPLQMGDGKYKLTIFKNIEDITYEIMYEEYISIKKINQNNLFIQSTAIINYSDNMSAIKKYSNELKDKSYEEKIHLIYNDIINEYIYDEDKMATIPATYVPDIGEVYSQKKGICYDYSVLLAGILRSEGIPVKLVMGYSTLTLGYHSWNEIYINGKWITVDPTFDSIELQLGNKTTFEKDKSMFSVVKVY